MAKQCTISANLAYDSGSGAYVHSGELDLIGCTVSYNKHPTQAYEGSYQGGGVAVSSEGIARLIGTEISYNNATDRGGGVYNSGTLQVELCVFRGNYTRFDGGGMYALGSTLVTSTLFQSNLTSIDGGGGGFGGGALVEDCLFIGNMSLRGGAINGGPTVRRTTFSDNRSTTGGACRDSGIYEDCVFVDNVAVQDGSYLGRGGAVFGYSLGPQLIRCVFINNRTELYTGEVEGYGGAVFGGGQLFNCLLLNNQAGEGGSAYQTTLTNCTVINNTATYSAGGCYDSVLRNSIVWANVPDNLSASVANYCDVGGGWSGVGNISADPQFWDPVADDFQLKPLSPCIDAGDPALPPDPDGSIADMGAYPFDTTYCPEPATYCTPKTNLLGCSPSMSFTGSPALSGPDDFTIRASHLTSIQVGMLIWGQGSSAMPFYGGTLCVQPPVIRAGIQNSGGNTQQFDCSGSFSFHFSHGYMAQQLLAVGTTLFAQYWMRDVADPQQLHVGLTDGLRFSVCP